MIVVHVHCECIFWKGDNGSLTLCSKSGNGRGFHATEKLEIKIHERVVTAIVTDGRKIYRIWMPSVAN